jgi:tetratricopeptide (TPR) repeat protein
MGALPSQIGKYQIDSLLGKGGMGEVYKAHDANLGRYVALKIMRGPSLDDTTAKERFVREAQSAGGLRHPNIVTVYDLGEVEGQMYIAMEFIVGRDLEEMIKGKMALTLEEKLNIMTQVCEGLGYAHKHQIVHRDMKPSNIRIDEEGVVKIMDFGIAKLESSNMTASGTVMGTPYYMSPEQVRGLRVDNRSDIFALGAILYELLTYQKAFTGEMAAVFFKIVHESPAPLSEYLEVDAQRLQEIVDRCLQKDKAERLQTAGELADLLRLAIEFYRDSNGATTTGLKTVVATPATDFQMPVAPAAVGNTTRKRTGAHVELTAYAPSSAAPVHPGPMRPAAAGDRSSMMIVAVLLAMLLLFGIGGGAGYYFYIHRGPAISKGEKTPGYDEKLKQAKSLHQAGKFEEAIVLYGQLEKEDPGDADVHFLLGAANSKIGQSQKALSEYQTAVELDPKLDKAWQQIGFVLLNRSDWKGAENAFLRALEIAPNSGPTLDGLAQTYLISQQSDKAEQAYQRLIQIEPANVQAIYNLGQLILARKDFATARGYFQKAIQINPNYAEAHNNLGAIYLEEGKVDASIMENEKAVQIKPMLSSAHYSLYLAYEQKQDFPTAGRYLQKYLELSNDEDPELKKKLAKYLK